MYTTVHLSLWYIFLVSLLYSVYIKVYRLASWCTLTESLYTTVYYPGLSQQRYFIQVSLLYSTLCRSHYSKVHYPDLSTQCYVIQVSLNNGALSRSFNTTVHYPGLSIQRSIIHVPQHNCILSRSLYTTVHHLGLFAALSKPLYSTYIIQVPLLFEL